MEQVATMEAITEEALLPCIHMQVSTFHYICKVLHAHKADAGEF